MKKLVFVVFASILLLCGCSTYYYEYEDIKCTVVDKTCIFGCVYPIACGDITIMQCTDDEYYLDIKYNEQKVRLIVNSYDYNTYKENDEIKCVLIKAYYTNTNELAYTKIVKKGE